ncbi:hypothetical protein ACROYT_G030757 [Oculina patagonica]
MKFFINSDAGFKPLNTLRTRFPRPKDKLTTFQSRCVVYRVNFLDCSFTYYGETDRALATRIKEHQRAVRVCDKNSKIAQHAKTFGHDMDFNYAAVMDKSGDYHKRLFLEAWDSQRDQNAGNEHIDIPDKYERRRCHVKDEREERAFSALSKEHMSSDEDDSVTEGEGGWVSRPPLYRSRTLELFLFKLDKRSGREEEGANKRWKRTKTRTGEPVEREPPTGTPKWALSDEWKEIIRRRELEQTEREPENEECSEEAQGEQTETTYDSDSNNSSDNEIDFNDQD